MPTVEAIKEGTPFTGILYAGLILTREGPKVIEFNARFGDPEAQVVLPRITSDFGVFMQALMANKPFDLQWKNEAMLGVVVAAEGYPGEVEKGVALPDVATLNTQGLDVFHAGTKWNGKNFVSAGGRILLVTAEAETLRKGKRASI